MLILLSVVCYTDVPAVLEHLHLPPQGTLQPCVDVPIRPWVDHLGRFQPRLWSAIVHRAVATVVQYPGVPGDVVLQSMRVVNPQHGREALSVLCTAGILRMEKKDKNMLQAGNVLAACFGQGGGSSNSHSSRPNNVERSLNSRDDGCDGYDDKIRRYLLEGLQDDSNWHFFANPLTCWEAINVLPPHVLVSGEV